MKTRVNKRLYTLSDLIENYTYSRVLELIDSYLNVANNLENDKRLLMYEFDDNDVEAMQIIDTIELQQYYVAENLDVLKQASVIIEKKFFMVIPNASILIGLN